MWLLFWLLFDTLFPISKEMKFLISPVAKIHLLFFFFFPLLSLFFFFFLLNIKNHCSDSLLS